MTSYDFTDESRKQHLSTSMETIIAHGMVPILNENDAVSGNKGYTEENVFSDNDALASLVAGQVWTTSAGRSYCFVFHVRECILFFGCARSLHLSFSRFDHVSSSSFAIRTCLAGTLPLLFAARFCR